MLHVIASENGMPVHRRMGLVESDDGIQVQVSWRGLLEPENGLEPVAWVGEDVPHLFWKLFG